ncbi:MAG: SGNH/GDSL hydrolase family protein, partial [Oscillospiraceae bacterium]|nr:SGNH/GDSL hydrolase family protein [Oscillospiraceae bacterium]
MKIKKITAIFTAAALSMALAACSKTEGTDTPTTAAADTGTTPPTTTAELSPEEQVHKDMIDRSFVSFGNTHRIEQKLSQAMRGDKTTVAYLGGSITEGIGGTPDTCYAKLSYNYIAENYGTGDNVEYVNAGVSGTPSILGNLRVKKDVLDKNADIVFVEFA